MHRLTGLWLAGVVVLACADPSPDPSPLPPSPGSSAHERSLARWADATQTTLSLAHACNGVEQRQFGARGSLCWTAKSRREQLPAGSRMFPRFEIVLATYADDGAALARLTRFRELPNPAAPERDKAYPLRAGFRIGAQVMIVTTDAFAFERDAITAAGELMRATGGTELMCWQACDR